jgi:RNA polymerase sigma factor (sigma-70 family)
MMGSLLSDHDGPGRGQAFVTTCWTVVLAAQDGDEPENRAALARLCEVYWYPLYAYVRRRGHDAHSAQDLTQEFFARLLEKEFLRAVDPTRGRFRSFLVMALDRFLSKEWRRSRRLKRGGGQMTVSLDAGTLENRYRAEPVDGMTPERIFERRWALELVQRSMDRLQAEATTPGKKRFFECVCGLLAGDRNETRHEQLAAGLGMSVNAFKVALHRLRQRHRALLRDEVLQTVAGPDEVDSEIRHLLAVLSA